MNAEERARLRSTLVDGVERHNDTPRTLIEYAQSVLDGYFTVEEILVEIKNLVDQGVFTRKIVKEEIHYELPPELPF